MPLCPLDSIVPEKCLHKVLSTKDVTAVSQLSVSVRQLLGDVEHFSTRYQLELFFPFTSEVSHTHKHTLHIFQIASMPIKLILREQLKENTYIFPPVTFEK